MTQIPEGFEKVCKIDSLKDRMGQRFMVNDVEIAVFKADDKIYAVQNHCPHQHAAIMYDGYVDENCYVFCPAHGWEFSLKDGCMPEGRKGLDTYETIIEDGTLYVKATKKEMMW